MKNTKLNYYWHLGWLSMVLCVALAVISKADFFPLWIDKKVLEISVYVILGLGILSAFTGAEKATKNNEVI